MKSEIGEEYGNSEVLLVKTTMRMNETVLNSPWLHRSFTALRLFFTRKLFILVIVFYT